MAQAQNTIIIITSTDTSYTVPGDLSPTQIIANYSSDIPGISAMSYTQTLETRPDGVYRVVTFSARSGTKG